MFDGVFDWMLIGLCTVVFGICAVIVVAMLAMLLRPKRGEWAMYRSERNESGAERQWPYTADR